MYRRSWFFGLSGAAAAAVAVAVAQIKLPTMGGGAPPPVKPANGQCPVCGTVAPKIAKRTDGAYVCQVVIDPQVGLTGSYECGQLHSSIVRCSHCSAAFYQDAV